MLNQELPKSFKDQTKKLKKSLFKVLSEMYVLDFQAPFDLIDLEEEIPIKKGTSYSLDKLSKYFKEKDFDLESKRIIYLSFSNASTPVHAFELQYDKVKGKVSIDKESEVIHSHYNYWTVSHVSGVGYCKEYLKPEVKNIFGEVVTSKNFILIATKGKESYVYSVARQEEAFTKRYTRIKRASAIGSYAFIGQVSGGASKVKLGIKYCDSDPITGAEIDFIDKSGYYLQRKELKSRLLIYKARKLKNILENGSLSEEVAQIDVKIAQSKKKLKEFVSNCILDEQSLVIIQKATRILLNMMSYREELNAEEGDYYFKNTFGDRRTLVEKMDRISNGLEEVKGILGRSNYLEV